jgi:two-component system sensor histidine kinase QseC
VTSIRRFLVIVIIATIALLNFLAVLQGYQASMKKAQVLFDAKLMDTLQLFVTVSSNALPTRSNSEAGLENMALQIWQGGEQLLYRTANTPTTPISHFEPGFSDTNFNHYRWRTLAYHDADKQRWYLLAERIDTQSLLAETVVLESVLPTLLSLPLIGVLIWWITGVGLKPLQELAKELTAKKTNDLNPITISSTPKELATVVDSTNQLLQKLADAFQRETLFAADAAHELRTPLAILDVHLHNLLEQYPDNEHALQLKKGFARQKHVIEQILSLYRSSQKSISERFTSVLISPLLQEVIADELVDIESRQQTIALYADNESVIGDDFSLRTLFKNLISNASKYTPVQGEIEIRVMNQEDGIHITIEDSGPGIPDAEYERVFDRFYRIKGDQHDSNITGCGLGLSIVQYIAVLHQVNIELGQSETLGGLKVTLKFPQQTQSTLFAQQRENR